MQAKRNYGHVISTGGTMSNQGHGPKHPPSNLDRILVLIFLGAFQTTGELCLPYKYIIPFFILKVKENRDIHLNLLPWLIFFLAIHWTSVRISEASGYPCGR